jgi:hypothetical protein
VTLRSLAALVLAAAAAVPAAAQDQALDPLLFIPTTGTTTQALLSARTLQLYRLPLDYTVRPMSREHWGISLTCPLSVTGARVTRATNAGQFVRSLGVFAIVPGIAFDIPLADALRLHPFFEAGIGKGTARAKTQVLYGVGASARLDRQAGRGLLTFGGSAARRRLATDTGEYEAHSTFEAGIDAQMPIGTAGGRVVRAGGYGIARAFQGLRVTRPDLATVDLDHQFEAGASLSTAPEIRIWKITLPWIAVGYQFGTVLTGVRIYTSFPF